MYSNIIMKQVQTKRLQSKKHNSRKIKIQRTKKRLIFKKAGSSQVTNEVTNEDMNKCHNFCNTEYPEKYKKWLYNEYNTNPYLIKQGYNKKSENEKNKIFMSKKEEAIKKCNHIYCNPKCPEYGKNNPLHYACPICKARKSKEMKQYGAITFCSWEDVL